MATRGYEFYLRVLKVSLTSEGSELVREEAIQKPFQQEALQQEALQARPRDKHLLCASVRA